MASKQKIIVKRAISPKLREHIERQKRSFIIPPAPDYNELDKANFDSYYRKKR